MIQFVTFFICINKDYLFLVKNMTLLFFYKPVVAGSVLQKPLWLINTQFVIEFRSCGQIMADLKLFKGGVTWHLENIQITFLDLKNLRKPTLNFFRIDILLLLGVPSKKISLYFGVLNNQISLCCEVSNNQISQLLLWAQAWLGG